MWAELMEAIHESPDRASGFYLFLALAVSIPMRVASKLLQRIPASWMNGDTVPMALAFVGWVSCWIVVRLIPGLNATALEVAVVGGALVTVAHRRLAEPVGKHTDRMADSVRDAPIFKAKENGD